MQYFQDSLKTVERILVSFPFSIFFVCFVSEDIVHPSSSNDTGRAWKKSRIILVKRTRYSEHWWRDKDKFIRNVRRWTPSYGCVTALRLARNYIHKLSTDTRCCLDNMLRSIDGLLKTGREFRAISTTWWWWYAVLLISLQMNTKCVSNYLVLE